MPKKTPPNAAKKPDPQTRASVFLPPVQAFEYEAFGFVDGTLVDQEVPYLQMSSGETLTVKGFDERLRRWLDTQEQPVSGFFGVYPKSTRSGPVFWVKCFQEAAPELEAGLFLIAGQLFSTKGETHLLRIHRNQTHNLEKPFLVKVSGFLPQAKPGQFWKLECQLEAGHFSLLDGYRLNAVAL